VISIVSIATVVVFSLVAGKLGQHWLAGRDARHLHYGRMSEQSPEGVLVVDATTLLVVDANAVMRQSTGYGMDELRVRTLEQLFVDNARAKDPPFLAEIQKAAQCVPLQFRLSCLCKDGSSPEVEVNAYQWSHRGRALFVIKTVLGAARLKIAAQLLDERERLDHLAHHDLLTHLPNRLYLAQYLPGAIEDASRRGKVLAILFLDLDRFKHINDSRGHDTGDSLLKTVAERVRETVRREDVVVRMGGDEFIVVLQDVERLEAVQQMAARINDALSVPVIVDGMPITTSVSIGVSLYPRDGADMGELLRRSDTAMYQAKERGRNNFQLFSPVMDRKLRERVAIEASLREALNAGLLDVHYQPIVDIESRKVVWLEALLRWKHPHQGPILPNRFIDVAEETGLIVPLGDFVLQHVMEDLCAWRKTKMSLVPIAVNISAVQLQRSDLHEKIVALTTQHGISPDLLQLELTESAMFEQGEGMDGTSRRDALSRLRELGVGMSIDDFGTGYSSLSYLKQWHVHCIKIDRSFVRDLVTDMNDLAIVGAILAMARHLDIKVVAEGIEGWQQLEKLRQLGCNFAQGYLFARPADGVKSTRFLTGMPLDLIDGSVTDQSTEISISALLERFGT
jgi:diguanylate cyclase (GGDEF)-like protein/PAS domain S-box-containing protein